MTIQSDGAFGDFVKYTEVFTQKRSIDYYGTWVEYSRSGHFCFKNAISIVTDEKGRKFTNFSETAFSDCRGKGKPQRVSTQEIEELVALLKEDEEYEEDEELIKKIGINIEEETINVKSYKVPGYEHLERSNK